MAPLISTCPICEQPIPQPAERCPSCRSLVSLQALWPVFDRRLVDEAAVQGGITRARELLSVDAKHGPAHYCLGLAYLNLGLREQALTELRQAASLLPEQHRINYELAVIEAAGGATTAAIDHLDRALQQAPEQTVYRYLELYLTGIFASGNEKPREAVHAWIDAYRLNPQAVPAREALQTIVASCEDRLRHGSAQKSPGITPAQREALDVLNGRVRASMVKLPSPPAAPRPLGKTSMRLIRRLAPDRAKALEQMYAANVSAYETAVVAYEDRKQSVSIQNETSIAAHEQRIREIRENLPLLAEISALVLENEIRQRQEAERREAELARRRQEQQAQQQAAAAQRLANQQARVATTSTNIAPPAKERNYHSTRATYRQGLPVGREGASVTLTITNQRIFIKYSALIGGWEYTIPMSALVEVSDDVQQKMLSKEHRLRISYRDPQGMLAHAIFAQVKVEPCVRKILQARSGS